MKKIEIRLKVIKNDDKYEIYINDLEQDYFKLDNKFYEIEAHIYKLIINSLKLDLNNHELQKHLVENYLEKDVEDMSNKEFAEYLVENLKGLWIHNDVVYYKHKVTCENGIVYNISADDINYFNWHHGLLVKKTSFCNFNHDLDVPSKGNRKKFISAVKQTIEHLESFELKLED